ncbi:DUF5666 domain-containing protein [Mycobacterium sp.]|uniref:DUF5666 domain-containing protein n=1 Tax=Mycobacterium sp. TaxID=1785 RepID=UPI0025D0256D|nr:DUF5666 domain-containing protein [Mycobacterium sp.]
MKATRLALVAIAGATALSVAACGNSNTATPSQPASPTSSTSAQAQPPSSSPSETTGPGGTDRVTGLIASVAGDSIQVTEQSGTGTVNFTTSTKVNELTSAGLQDVTVGSCVGIKPTKDSPQSGGTVTAEGVRITPAVDGKCAGPKQPPAGETPPDSPPGGPGGGPPPGPPVQGTVASVAGNTITVNATDGTSTTVTVTDKTRYSKEGVTNSQAIAAGKCITAEGTQGNGGALQATEINLRPATTNGKCPGGGPPHGHGG